MKPATRQRSGYFVPFIRHGDQSEETARTRKSGSNVKYLNKQDALDFAQSIIDSKTAT